MPSIISHAVIPLALGLALGKTALSRRLLVAGVIAAILPDADVLAFHFGVPYADQLGHRGMSHSLAFAALIGILACAFARQLQTTRRSALLFVFVATASHGLLDMLTNGGLGVGLFWPYSDTRFFFPYRVIAVSPLDIRRFFGPTGAIVLLSECVWIWLPSALGAAIIFWCRRVLEGRSPANGVGY